MLRLMGESPSMQLQLPLSQSQPPSPCLRSTCPPILSSTCPPTPLLGPFTQSLLPTGPLDLSSHSGALHPSVQLLQQAQLSQHQLIKPMQPHEDSRTCSSYASSLFSSSHYPSPQLVPLAVSQPLLSTHQTPQHTPLLVPAWQEHADGSQEWSGHLAQQRPCALERAPSQEPGAAEFLAAISAQPTQPTCATQARCRLSSCATAECIARVPGAGSWLSIVAHRSHADGWLRCVPAVCATAASASSGRASPGSRRGRLQARTRSGCGQVLDTHGRQGKGALVCGREPLRRRRARPTVHAVPGGTACPDVHD